MKKQLLLFLLLMLPLITIADTVQTEIECINYNIETDNQTATVTRKEDPADYFGNVVIPATVVYNGIIYRVIGIEEYAFNNCDELRSVTIGENVEFIGECAFQCSCLDTVTVMALIPPALYWNSFSSYGFLYVPRQSYALYKESEFWKQFSIIRVKPTEINGLFYELYEEPLHAKVVECQSSNNCVGYQGDIVIPNQIEEDGLFFPVTEIGDFAFQSCEELKSIALPEKLTTIGEEAISYCPILESLFIPKYVNTIANNAFFGCDKLTNVTVDKENQTFDSRDGCNAIIESSTGTLVFGFNKSTIPEGVTSIENNAFRYCSKLDSVVIPSSLESIGLLSFEDCSGLHSIVVKEGNTLFDSRDGCNAIIETATNTLLLGCLTTVIPQTVKIIGKKAYRTTRYLEEIIIPEGIEEIQEGAYEYSINATEVRLPTTLKTLGETAFYGMTNLQTIYLPEQLTKIGNMAFTGSDHLSDVFCYSEDVPEAAWLTFGDFRGNMMPYSVNNMNSATLHVPETCVEQYASQSPWNLFGNIVALQKHTLKFLVDHVVIKTIEYYEGALIRLNELPSREGYTYQCQFIPDYMPNEDLTIEGTFVPNRYQLTYIVDGEEYKTNELEYGAIITPEAEPTKEGYTFSGWSEIPETMPAHDVTITGTFSINSYKLTYVIDNEVYKEVMYEYGATITPEPQPEGDYLTFEWVGVPETMPAHDVVVTAVYETGIIDILTLQGIKAIYTPNGRKLDKPQKGLNIIVMQDGTVKKVVVK